MFSSRVSSCAVANMKRPIGVIKPNYERINLATYFKEIVSRRKYFLLHTYITDPNIFLKQFQKKTERNISKYEGSITRRGGM